MDTKTLKKYNLVKGTGDKQEIGVPYKLEKGYTTRWVKKPNEGQWKFIKDYIDNNPAPKKKVSNKK